MCRSSFFLLAAGVRFEPYGPPRRHCDCWQLSSFPQLGNVLLVYPYYTSNSFENQDYESFVSWFDLVYDEVVKKPNLLLLVLLFLSALFNLNFYQKQSTDNMVIEVVDGDTFQLRSGKRVRLMGVDAPEFDRCGGKEAKERLGELVLGKKVKLAEETTEAYGRSLALVYVKGELVNKIILEEGWGRTDYRKNTQREVLTQAFHDGQDKGLNELCISPKPVNSKCVVKGNIDPASYDKFYHLPGCQHYQETIINLAFGDSWFCSEKEAKAKGFKKAASCP